MGIATERERARRISLRAADVVLGDDDVLRVIVHEGAEVGPDDTRSFLAARLELAPTLIPVLIDLRRIRNMTREAQEVMTRGGVTRPTVCVALLIEGPIAVMIANFFIIFGKPRYPTRLFTSEQTALAWIEEMRGRGRANDDRANDDRANGRSHNG